MSKTLLQQLYDGELCPAETIPDSSPEYKELQKKIFEEKDYFKELLSPDDWDRFKWLSDIKLEQSTAYAFANFTYGFRLGVTLMTEVFGKSYNADDIKVFK